MLGGVQPGSGPLPPVELVGVVRNRFLGVGGSLPTGHFTIDVDDLLVRSPTRLLRLPRAEVRCVRLVRRILVTKVIVVTHADPQPDVFFGTYAHALVRTSLEARGWPLAC